MNFYFFLTLFGTGNREYIQYLPLLEFLIHRVGEFCLDKLNCLPRFIYTVLYCRSFCESTDSIEFFFLFSANAKDDQ